MRTGIIGAGSTIAEEFMAISPGEVLDWRNGPVTQDLDRYLICIGYLAGKRITEMSAEDLDLTWDLNFVQPVQICEGIFAANPRARICLLGSESGFSGSFDIAYAGAKAALHSYVKTRKLAFPDQMLVAVAPHIIWDSHMTAQRKDLAELEARGAGQRLGRWLTAMEVAQEALSLLEGSPAVSGTIVRMRVS